MSYREIYKSKLVTPNDAISRIKSGNRVIIGHAAGEPQTLVEELVKNAESFQGVEIVHMVALGKGEYCNPEMRDHFRHNALFVGSKTRDAVNSERGDYTPCFFYKVPRLFIDGSLPIDVALVQLSTPDENGYCSFGVSNDYTKPAVEAARIVIAELNTEMPRTFGDSFIHISDLDCIVETSRPLIEVHSPKITDIEEKIGRYCAELINDGDTLQLGIGTIPDAVLLFLKDKKDLGIHSEMISDGILELFENGVINNKKKSIHKGKTIITFAMGTKKLYDYLDNNPMVEFYPVNYVNDPVVIAQNDNMVSINSCIQIDLMGQVVSETIGSTQISGVGGQVDFIRGASMSKNGRSIIAIPSTAAKGKISRIVSRIDDGASVTTTRNDVDYIVTEYGVARLRGKTLKQRGIELISIAHPDFKAELIEAWENKFKISYK